LFSSFFASFNHEIQKEECEMTGLVSVSIDYFGLGKKDSSPEPAHEVLQKEGKQTFTYWYAGGRLHVAGCTCSQKHGGPDCLKGVEEPQ
jgi:hypothetical protein